MKQVLYVLIALALTETVECPIAALWYRRWRAVAAVFLCNMLTNPLINLEMSFVSSFLGFRTAGYWVILALSEIVVVVCEGLLISSMLEVSRKKALLFSLAANAVSYLSGVLLELLGII